MAFYHRLPPAHFLERRLGAYPLAVLSRCVFWPGITLKTLLAANFSDVPYFVYLLECDDGSLYTGITTDVERRFAEHKRGIGSHFTRAKKAKQIVYTERHPSRSSAQRREAEIKSWPREKKLALIG